MEVRYRKFHKGWNGTKYYMPMTEGEMEARRKVGLILGVVIGTPIWTIIMCIAAGLIK